MKKSSRYIAICITALFLSICIPFVSFAMETVGIYYSHDRYNVTGSTYNSLKYYSPTDSTSDFPPTFTNLYVNYDDYNDGYFMLNYSSSPNIIIDTYFDSYPDSYNSFDTIIICNQDTSGNWFQRLYYSYFDSNRNSWRNNSITLFASDVRSSSPKVFTYNGVTIYCSFNQITIPGPTGNFTAYKVSFYSDEYIRLFQMTNAQMIYTSGYFLIPIYKIKYSITTYTEWEQEQKQMHEQTLYEISQIGDDVSRVGDEVSKIGDEISQFHNDLTSYDESDAPTVNDYDMSDNIDTINSFDTEISNFIDDNNGYNSYDYDAEYSGIGDNFSWDEQTDGDMSFWDFVVNLWGTLQMRVIIVTFVPLAFAYVILKFVIGGIM